MATKNRIIEKETFNLNNLRDLCRDSPILIINTSCGVGKYTFNKIILASKSGVRKKILEKNNIHCEVIPANIDEKSVNAFAAPGGIIGVNAGLF